LLPSCQILYLDVSSVIRLIGSIEVELENHGRVKIGKNIQDSWICNDCITKRTGEATSTIQDDSNSSIHHEHIGVANKSDVSPNTPTAGEDDVNSRLTNE
jgi:hypothetical protein